ncbi:MAG TPA: hypothetical protein VN636_08400 [Acidimicrobiia bacterium]|nr:hypothetical protein [Acidimicrobiia bacterium]
MSRENRKRLLQLVILLVGLAAIAFAVVKTVNDTQEHVMPSPASIVVAGGFAIVAVLASARAWVALFSDLVPTREDRAVLRGTLYLAQLTKYLPVGGVAQAASQVTLARSVGVPLKRSTVAVPVSAIGAIAGAATLGAGLVFDTNLSGWVRLLALAGLSSVLLLRRQFMARALDLARRFVRRIPESDQLPTQSDIFMFYGWTTLTTAALCTGYSAMVYSLDPHVNPYTVFCAFAMSWVIGFIAVPIPAGVGIREVVLVALIPGVGTAPILAASLVLRLLSITAELLGFGVNRLVTMRHRMRAVDGGSRAPVDAAPPPEGRTAV